MVDMSEEAEEEPGNLPIIAHDGGGARTNTPATAGFGHEGFVQPSSYLRRSRAISRPMTPVRSVTAVDREQHKGLVSRPCCLLGN